jgi:hypothetical protein
LRRVRNIQLRVCIKSELGVLVLCHHRHYAGHKAQKNKFKHLMLKNLEEKLPDGLDK